MKTIFSSLNERQIAVLSLVLTALAVVVGVALPEIREMIGLDRDGKASHYQAQSMQGSGSNDSEATPVEPPAPPSTESLSVIEIKDADTLSGVQEGEFVVYPSASFVITGAGKGKIVIKKDAKVQIFGVFKGDVINEGGKFDVKGVHIGAVKRSK